MAKIAPASAPRIERPTSGMPDSYEVQRAEAVGADGRADDQGGEIARRNQALRVDSGVPRGASDRRTPVIAMAENEAMMSST